MWGFIWWSMTYSSLTDSASRNQRGPQELIQSMFCIAQNRDRNSTTMTHSVQYRGMVRKVSNNKKKNKTKKPNVIMSNKCSEVKHKIITFNDTEKRNENKKTHSNKKLKLTENAEHIQITKLILSKIHLETLFLKCHLQKSSICH